MQTSDHWKTGWFLLTLMVVSDTSELADRTPLSEARAPRTEISAPRKLTVKVVSRTSVKVKWRDSDLKEEGEGRDRTYAVRYGSASSKDPFQTVYTPSRRLNLHGLEPGVLYDVNVRVVQDNAHGPWSKLLKVQIDEREGTIKEAVTNLDTKRVNTTSVVLTWKIQTPKHQPIDHCIITVHSSVDDNLNKRAIVPSEARSYLVTGLTPNTHYGFTVQAATQRETTKGITISARTKPRGPTKSPRALRLRVLNSNILLVRWQSPPQHTKKGLLIGYKIQYKRQGPPKDDVLTVQISGDVRVYRIEGLQKGRSYKVRVAAINKVGDGPYSKWKYVNIGGTSTRRKNRKDKRGKKKSGKQRKKLSKDDDTRNPRVNEETESEARVTERNSPEVKVDGEQEAEMELTTRPVAEFSEKLTAVPTDQATRSPEWSSRRLPSSPQAIRRVSNSATTLRLAWDVPTSPSCCPVLAYRVEVRNHKDLQKKVMMTGDPYIYLTRLTPDTGYSVQVTTVNIIGHSSPSPPAVFQMAKAVAPVIGDVIATRVVLGRKANLTCKAYGEEPATISWLVKHDGLGFISVTEAPWIMRRPLVTFATSGHNTSASSLVLSNVTMEAEREFACRAINSAGSDQKIMSLVVEEAPSIVSTRGMRVMVGTAAQLECLVKGRPLPDIAWIHDASQSLFKETDERNLAVNNYVSSVLEGNVTRRSFLVIEKTSLSQKGSYACRATSDLGSIEAVVNLDVLVPPPPPVQKVQVIPLSTSRVSVSWMPPSDFPYPVLYYQVSFRDSQGGQPGTTQTSRVDVELASLRPNSTYFIGVTAATEHGLGEIGPEVKVTTLSNVGLEPMDLSVDPVSATSVEVKWKRPSSLRPIYIQGYYLYLRPWKDSQVKRHYIRDNNAEKFIISLGKSNQYDLRLSTLTTWGYEAFTAWIQFMKPQRRLPPKRVRDLSAISIKAESVVIRWREPKANFDSNVHHESDKILGYTVGYQPIDQPQHLTAQEEINTTRRQVQLQNLDPNSMYLIHVVARGHFGTSEEVYLDVKTTPLPPTVVLNATARAVSSTKIHLNWKPPKRGPVTRYHIRYWRPGHKDKQSAWMSGSYRDYIAGSLMKHSNYRFEVIPYNGDLLGEGIVIFSSTFPDKPDGPPRDVKLVAVDAKTLIASWNPPDPGTTYGKVKGYRLVLKSRGGQRVANFEVTGDRQNFTFLNMKINTGYKLRMAAINANGTGVFSQAVSISYNQEPQVPASPENMKIRASETTLTIQWDEPQFTGSPTLGYIVGYGKFIPDVFRTVLDNSQMIHTLKDLKPNSGYIVSVRAFNSIGESKPTFRLARTKALPLKPLPLEAPLGLTVLADMLTSLQLSWIDPALIKVPTLNDNRFYQIRFSSIDGEAYSYLNTSSTTYILRGLERSTIYETSVRVVRGNKTSDWSMTAVNSTQQLVPGSPPVNIMATSIAGKPTSLYLNWSEPEQPHGLIEKYIIYLSHDPTLDPEQWVILDTAMKQVTIRNLTPHIPYYLKVRASNKAGNGPLSPMVVYTPPSDILEQPIILSISGTNGNDSTKTNVVWEAPEVPTSTITGYMVYYTKSTGNIYSDWMIQFERDLDCFIRRLDFNTTYLFKVCARYTDGTGPFSQVVRYTTPEGRQRSQLGNIPNEKTSGLSMTRTGEGRDPNDGGTVDTGRENLGGRRDKGTGRENLDGRGFLGDRRDDGTGREDLDDRRTKGTRREDPDGREILDTGTGLDDQSPNKGGTVYVNDRDSNTEATYGDGENGVTVKNMFRSTNDDSISEKTNNVDGIDTGIGETSTAHTGLGHYNEFSEADATPKERGDFDANNVGTQSPVSERRNGKQKRSRKFSGRSRRQSLNKKRDKKKKRKSRRDRKKRKRERKRTNANGKLPFFMSKVKSSTSPTPIAERFITSAANFMEKMSSSIHTTETTNSF